MRKGTGEQADGYCRKGPSVRSTGEMAQQGRRTDLEDAVELVRTGGAALVAEEKPHVFVKFHKGLEKLETMKYQHRTGPPKVIWIWGPSGSGKTREAAQGSFYMKDGSIWWDGYKQEDRIVIDDFDGKWPFRDLLRLLDRYPYQGQIKGGYVKINSPEIWITCEFPPGKYWEESELSQIKRRCTEVRCTEVAGNTNCHFNG